jgi:hypothetical protein
MKDPCKPSTSVKVLRNAVKIKTGKKTKLTKRNICEVITDIKTGKLPLPPLVLTRDRSYLLDKKSPFTSNEYDKLFDKTSSRAVLKRLAEKINIKKVDTLTKSQLIDAILKRLQFLNISEPVKLPAAVSSPTAAPAPKVTVITKPNQVKKSEVIRTTNKGLIEAIPQKTVPGPLRVNSRVPVAPEQGKVILGDRNYDLLFDPKTRKSELIRIAKKVNVENIDKMTRKELIEATTKRLRFMTNRGLTKKAPVPFAPPLFPKVPNRPQPITTPSFLQVKPKAPTPETGLVNYSRGGPNVPKKVNFSNGEKRNTNTPNDKKGSFLNFSNGGKRNTNVPNFLKKANAPNVAKKVNAPNAKKGKSFLNFFGGGKKNTNAPNVPKKVNASNAKKGKSFLNFFRGGKKKTNAPNVPKKVNVPNVPKKNTNAPNVPKKVNVPNVPINNTTTVVNEVNDSAVNNMTEELTNNAVISELNNNLAKNIVNDTKNNNLNLAKNIVNNTKKDIGTRINKVANNKVAKIIMNDTKNNNLNLTKNILNNTKKDIGTRINKVANNKVAKNIANDTKNNNLNLAKNIVNNTKKDIGTRINKTKNNNLNLAKNIVNNSKNNIGTRINKVAKNIPNNTKNDTLNRNLMNDIINNTRTNIVTRINATPMNTTEIKMNNMTEDLVNNAVNEELTNEIMNEINAGPLTDEIIDDLVTKIINQTPVMRFGGRAAEPNQLTNDILTNVEQDVSKEIVTTFNNPLFNNKRTTINNPLFNNKKDGSEELSKYINNLGLQNENKQKLMSLFNTTNQTLEDAKRNATTIRNTRKLEKNANFTSEREKLRNKITKELNMVPNNNGKFSERRGLTKGRIGIWARELKKAKTVENLKNIDNTLAKKTALRRDIENKYTKMGLTKVEKMNHRRKTMKFLNNVDARRELVEIQVKNKTNNNNTNSVISNYNSNANSNEPKRKMKYGSRENFINAKKVELRDLAKNTSTNFSRNINRLETRTNVAKLRGRIEGAIRRNKTNTRPRGERRVNNRAELKLLKKQVKKNNPGFTPKKVNAEARRLRALSRL